MYLRVKLNDCIDSYSEYSEGNQHDFNNQSFVAGKNTHSGFAVVFGHNLVDFFGRNLFEMVMDF